MKKVTTRLAVVGAAIILAFGSVSGLAAVHAAEGCSHGSFKDVFNPMYSWEEPCTLDTTCTITYTKIRRTTYCTSCHKLLGESTFDYYKHSKTH